MSKPIYHLADATDAAQLHLIGSYRAPSLDSEGFIHCCTSTQLPGVIQRYYADAESLVLLHLDAQLLTHNVVFENTMGGEEQFPHVYGEINAAAVTKQVMLGQTQIKQIADSPEYQP